MYQILTDKMDKVLTVDFITGVMLLLFGSLLTGILVPFIKSVIDLNSAKNQKILEAQLSRQKEIIDAQIGFLTNFSNLTWKLVFEVFKVSYAFAWETVPLQNSAYQDYGPKSWELLCTIRACMSTGVRLTNMETQQLLDELFDYLIFLDDTLCSMADKPHPQKQWQIFHTEHFMEVGKKVDQAISKLSADLKLSMI